MPGRKTQHPDRRNPCTHTSMTRFYDPWGTFKCSLCQRHPNIGWLYRCTQDSKGVLPASDFIADHASLNHFISPTQDVNLHTLSDPIIKSIGDGQYTTDQIKFLIQQKENVRDVIIPHQQRPATPSTATTSSSSSSSCIDDTLSTLPHSPTFSTTSTTSLDEEIRAAYDWKELNKTWMSDPLLSPSESTAPGLPPEKVTLATPRSNPSLFKDCSYIVCHTCRPTYRERAIQSLPNILNSPTRIPPAWEIDNRPVSDARVLARLRVPERIAPRDTTRDGWGEASYNINDPTPRPEKPASTTDTISVTDNHSVRKRSGFRQTVRRALARARGEDLTDGCNLPQERLVEPASGTHRSSRSLVFRRRRSPSTLSFVATHGRVLDTSVLQDSVILMVASNTPLPSTPIALVAPSPQAAMDAFSCVGHDVNRRLSGIIAQL